MLTLTDSTGLLADPPALRRRMAEDGYVFFRGLLGRDRVLEVGAEVLDELARVGWIAPGSPLDDPRPARKVPQEGADYESGIEAVQRREAVHRLANVDALRVVMHALLGESSFIHPAHVVRVVWPFPTGGGAPDPSWADWIHQDWSILHVPDMFTAWYPLLDTPREVGPLRLLTGSHRRGLIGRIWAAEETGIDSGDPRWATTDYEAGDLVVFHCLTAHTGMINTSARIRVSCEARMQALAHPIPALQLSPSIVQHWRASPTLSSVRLAWEELSADWKSTAWFDYPEQVEVFDHAAVTDLDHPESEFLADVNAGAVAAGS